MHHTEDLSNRLIRLPLWANMPAEDVAYVTENVAAVLDPR
jgi:dTDP-4-amino-4,6-dideoxygalactose transaminase